MNKLNFKTAKAIAFDMDGTILDSAGLWSDAFDMTCEKFDVRLENSQHIEFYEFAETPFINIPNMSLNQKFWEFCIAKYDLKTTHNLTSEIAHKTNDAFAHELFKTAKYKPDAEKFLMQLKDSKIPIILVTMCSRENLDLIDKYLSPGIRDIFGENIITSDMVTNKKPHPEPYLMACEKLGITPSDLIVFEDTYAGAKSGLGAGATVAIIYDKHAESDRNKLIELCEIHFDTWNDVIRRFKS